MPAARRPARVVLVDDASPVPVAADEPPAGVELVRRPANGGFGAAVNTGLDALAAPVGAADAAGGPAIEHALVLNSDLQIRPGFCAAPLAHALPWMPAVVGCRNVGEDGGSGYAARYFPTISHQVVEWLVPLASQRHRDVVAPRRRPRRRCRARRRDGAGGLGLRGGACCRRSRRCGRPAASTRGTSCTPRRWTSSRGRAARGSPPCSMRTSRCATWAAAPPAGRPAGVAGSSAPACALPASTATCTCFAAR
ncbi:hypothetical protein [Brachybacterium sp. GPGPB12]|uniref:glycosyltransferase family 2 protein n=1 Tax=Brachybacterium sp. GPGPB12 TaxID=3023517 RepID=UPI0031342482